MIPALDAVVEAAAEQGVEEFVMGMAHRGRLNTLTNIFGKSSRDIFSEFDGKDYEENGLRRGRKIPPRVDVQTHHRQRKEKST